MTALAILKHAVIVEISLDSKYTPSVAHFSNAKLPPQSASTGELRPCDARALGTLEVIEVKMFAYSKVFEKKSISFRQHNKVSRL